MLSTLFLPDLGYTCLPVILPCSVPRPSLDWLTSAAVIDRVGKVFSLDSVYSLFILAKPIGISAIIMASIWFKIMCFFHFISAGSLAEDLNFLFVPHLHNK